MSERRIKCPACGSGLRLAATIAPGRSVKCPKCARAILVPDEPVASAPVTEVPQNPVDAPPKNPAATFLRNTLHSVSGEFFLCGMFVVATALVTLNRGHDWYGRGPNVSVPDHRRQEAFETMFYSVLGAGLAVFVVGMLIQTRQRWAVYLGFPITLGVALVWGAALFAVNAEILWIILTVVIVPAILFAGLVMLLIAMRDARVEAEFQDLRAIDPGGDEVAKLVRLLQHPKSDIRLHSIYALKAMGPAANRAVPALITSLLKASPPDATGKNLCGICGQKLSVWTRDRIKTPERPDGIPACLGCRNRLRDGGKSEAQFVVEALDAIGPAPAAPALRKMTTTNDPFLKTACQELLKRLRDSAGK